MSSSDRRRALLGLGSVLAVAACTLWLAAAGRLDLYINPRYAVFTVVLAAVGVVASAAGLLAVARGSGHVHGADGDGGPHDQEQEQEQAQGHEHEHVRGTARSRSRRRALGRGAAAVGATVSVAVVVAMLVLPPTTLSARTAQQRSVDTGSLSAATGSSGTVSLLGSGSIDTSTFGVKDWAAIIRQTTDTSSLVGRRVTLTGFVVPAGGGGDGSGDGDGAFTVTRFVISCCAVDAQPVGVGVTTDDTVPGSDQWVRVSGALAANPDASSGARLVLRAATVTAVEQPDDPYEY